MHFETDRLILREWAPLADAQQAFDIYGDPQVTHWLDFPPDQSIHETQGRLQRYLSRSTGDACILAILEKAIDRIIGTLVLVHLPGTDGEPMPEMEIGWHLRQSSWGYGYATEAARPVAAYALTQIPELYAVALPDNRRSVNVMKRLGMTELGLTKKYHGGRELILYRVTATDFQAAESSG
ncbi:MAG: GNAT family N-acetyltransferase [Cyanobacteria bacterium J06554_6]